MITQIEEAVLSETSIVSNADERPRSPWIPSYSVNSQGSTPLHTPRVTEDADVEELQPLSSPAPDNVEVPAEEPSPAVTETVAVETVEAEIQEEAEVITDEVVESTIVIPQVVLTAEITEASLEDAPQVTIDGLRLTMLTMLIPIPLHSLFPFCQMLRLR